MTTSEISLPNGAESRANPRTSLFLAATLQGADDNWPVKLRNMSADGALAEGSVLPPTEELITVMRGTLRLQARVVWSRPGKCGLKFENLVRVADWLSEKAAEVGSAGQRRVDLYQAQIRRDTIPSTHQVTARATAKDTPPDVLRQRMAEELEYVQRGLDQMADTLISDPYILARHAATLQQFDVLSQILGHLKKLTVAEDPATEASTIGMLELRRRLLR